MACSRSPPRRSVSALALERRSTPLNVRAVPDRECRWLCTHCRLEFAATTVVTMLTPLQGALFFSGWLAWTMDAWDFFSVSLSVDGLLETFDIPSTKRAKITTAITLTLLFRSLGAAIFG